MSCSLEKVEVLTLQSCNKQSFKLFFYQDFIAVNQSLQIVAHNPTLRPNTSNLKKN